MIAVDPLKLIVGAFLAFLIAFTARKARALDLAGMWAAAGLGTVIMGLGGFGWAAVLMGFFISSSLLSRLFKRKKITLDEKYAKGSQRDAGQVLANGGLAGLIVLITLVFSSEGHAGWLAWMAYAGALAAANADTWATELGALSPNPPRLITTFRQVERGTSGAISLLGTLSALGGSSFIALLAVLFLSPTSSGVILSSTKVFAGLSLAGLAGSLVDSLLGASLQAVFFCPVCRKETERHPLHTCGSPTHHLRGLHWLNNDWVNAFCTLAGALIGAGFTIF